MSFMLSPGVQIQEVDLTTIIPAVSTTAAGFAGFFRWGPVNKRILIDSEPTMATIFQPPGNINQAFYWTAASYLAYGSNLNMVRANGAGLMNATANGNGVLIENEDKYFVNNFNGNGGVYGSWAARYAGGLGNTITISVCGGAQAYSSNLTSLYGFSANANAGDLFFNTSSSVAANVVVGDLIQVGVPGNGSNGYVSVTGIQGLRVNTSAGLLSTTGNNLPIIRKWQYSNQFNGAPGTSPFVAQKGGANDEMHIIVVDANGTFYGSGTQGFILEKYPFVSAAQDAKNNDASPNFYKTVLFNNSRKIYWMDNPAGATNWGNNSTGTVFIDPIQPINSQLSGGGGLITPYNYTTFSGGLSDPNDGGLITAYSYFTNTDDVDVSLIPTGPASPTVQQWVLDNVSLARLDNVTFISPRYADVVNQVNFEATNIVNNYLPVLNRSSSYAFLDSGWKYMFDKYNNIYTYVPLNGDTAGLCAQTDRIADPWFSPAGYNRGTIKNLAKLAWNPSNVSGTSYRDLLYTNAVNPVVSFKGQGTVLFGDKTLQARPSAFDRINVRRLFIVLEKSIATAAKYSLFEFNDNFTRAAFVNMVDPFLRTIKGRRGIYDYKIVCDATNNTPDIIDADQFVGDIYCKPARSINYITLRFVAVGTGVSFDEIVGTF